MARRAFPHCLTTPIRHGVLLICYRFFFSFFCCRFSFGVNFDFFCCSLFPLSLFPVSPMTIPPYFILYPTQYEPDRGAARLLVEPRAKRGTCPACYEDQSNTQDHTLSAPVVRDDDEPSHKSLRQRLPWDFNRQKSAPRMRGAS
jgi:hypothetical protein